MIKTWLIPIVASTIIMASLLMVNLMALTGSIFLEGFLEKKAKLVLVDSLAKDIFNAVDTIAEVSVHSSNGNFSEFMKILGNKMECFKEKISRDEEYFNEHGISIRFEYSIEAREDECLAEITSMIYTKDLEGFFAFEQVHNTVKRLVSATVNGSTG
jgi:hypothetical protein